MYCSADQWIEIRRRVLNQEFSKRQAWQEYELHRQTLKKILSQSVPPERREAGTAAAFQVESVSAGDPGDAGLRPAESPQAATYGVADL